MVENAIRHALYGGFSDCAVCLYSGSRRAYWQLLDMADPVGLSVDAYLHARPSHPSLKRKGERR